jgi:hypothetical protein
MSLPPLADLFGYWHKVPDVVAEVREGLDASCEWERVWSPAPGWVTAVKPLPGGVPDTARLLEDGVAFVEGRDAFSKGIDVNSRRFLDRLDEELERRPLRLDRIGGDFGFVRFLAHGRAVVVRSCAGNVPLFVRPERDGVCVTTRLTALWRHVPAAPEIDRLVEMTWVVRGLDPFGPRTIFRDTWAVPTGHVVHTGPGVPFRAERYWRVPARGPRLPSVDETTAHAERLRELLVATLDRDLDAGGLNMLTLSGGADSSSLAVLAARTLQHRVGALSLVPPAEHPSADHMLNLIRQPVTEAGLAPWVRIPWSDLRMLELVDRGPQCAFPVVHGTFLSLPAVKEREPFSVLFGGEDADAVCGSALTLPDWVAATPASAILRSRVGLPGRHPRLRWLLWRAEWAMGRWSPGEQSPPELPSWVHPDVRREYRDSLEDVRKRVDDNGAWPGLSYQLRCATYITQGWEVTAPLGVRRSLPFRRREVLELAFFCHPSELIGPGYKKLLRAALRDDVPAAILDRPKDRWPHDPPETFAWPRDRTLPAEMADAVAPDVFPLPAAEVPADLALGLQRVAVTMTHRRALRSPTR